MGAFQYPIITGLDETFNDKTLYVSQNFPNPFSGTASIDVSLKNSSDVLLEVFDLNGRKVMEYAQKNMIAGNHRLTLDASGLTSGIYFYVVSAGEEKMQHRMIVVNEEK